MIHILKKLKQNSGFGLMGMVVIIFAITLAGSLIVTLTAPTTSTLRNRETKIKSERLRKAITAYKLSHGGTAGTNPPTLAALVTDDATPCTLDNNPGNVATYLTLQGWCGPYVDVKISQNATDYRTDGWGTAFVYDSATNIITSYGPDRAVGGGDDQTFSP